MIRSATSRAKPISWVTTSMVMPEWASSRMTSSTSLIISGSRALVGSSKSMIFGLHGQGPGDGHPLLLAAGELRRGTCRLLGDADPLQQLMASSSASLFFILRTQMGPRVMFCSTVRWGNRLNC